MSFKQAAADLAAATFDHLGEEASYTDGFAMVTAGLKVTLDEPDVEFGGEGARLVVGDAVIRVAAAQLAAAPAAPGFFTLGAQKYYVVDKARADDPDRLTWACSVELRAD